MITACRTVRLAEIADVERGRDGVVYPVGTVYIRISACQRPKGGEKWRVLTAETRLDGSNYAIVIPKVPVIPYYLKTALEQTFDGFFEKYVGKSINIGIELFDFYTLQFHDSLSDQAEITNSMGLIDSEIEAVEKEIESMRKVKKYFLSNMMMF